MVGIPGGGVGVGDSFGYCRGELVETGGECAVVAVDQVSGGGVQSEAMVRDGFSQ